MHPLHEIIDHWSMYKVVNDRSPGAGSRTVLEHDYGKRIWNNNHISSAGNINVVRRVQWKPRVSLCVVENRLGAI